MSSYGFFFVLFFNLCQLKKIYEQTSEGPIVQLGLVLKMFWTKLREPVYILKVHSSVAKNRWAEGNAPIENFSMPTAYFML